MPWQCKRQGAALAISDSFSSFGGKSSLKSVLVTHLQAIILHISVTTFALDLLLLIFWYFVFPIF